MANKGGFYYDNQLFSKTMSVTLHANTELANGLGYDNDPRKSTDWVCWGIDSMPVQTIVNSGLSSDSETVSKSYSNNVRLSKYLEEQYGKVPHKYLASITSNTVNGTITKDNLIKKVNWSSYYGSVPIARAILTEDFQLNTNSNWTNVDGSDTMESLWRQLQVSGPMMGKLADIMLPFIDKSTAKGTLSSALKGSASFILHGLSSLSKNLNRALVVQGNRFTIYQGTNTNFNNMSMKFTLFSDWEPRYVNGKLTYVFVTVDEKLKPLWPYFQGRYRSLKNILSPEEFGEDADNLISIGWNKADRVFNDVEKGMTWVYEKIVDLLGIDKSGTVNKSIEKFGNAAADSAETAKDATKSWLDAHKEEIINMLKEWYTDSSEYIGFQDPPGGYNSQNKNIDSCQKGTLRLVFGGRYAIENLVGSDMNVSLSKTLMKNPTKENEVCPMSADVILNFKCASSWTNQMFQNFIAGRGALLGNDQPESDGSRNPVEN